eukprot:s1077_g4.t1
MLSHGVPGARWNVPQAAPSRTSVRTLRQGQQLTLLSEHGLPGFCRSWRGTACTALFAGVARSSVRGIKAASASGDKDVGTPGRPGGLSKFRELQGVGYPDLKVPVILFPVEDLLLPGRRKQMHLFEPRWVSMVEFSLKMCGGIFGMLYFDDGELFPVLSLVEIMSCNNLESQGRIVQVRAVGRARLKGLTEEVISAMDWGLALVEEMPEVFEADFDAANTALELSMLMEDLDITVTTTEDAATEEGAAEPEVPQLWTHQREVVRGNLAQLSPEKWHQLKEETAGQLKGVPMRTTMPSSLDREVTDSLAALAVLYASLSQVSLPLRKEFFVSSETLVKRLKVMSEKISELQGMARARRALAGVFGNDDK